MTTCLGGLLVSILVVVGPHDVEHFIEANRDGVLAVRLKVLGNTLSPAKLPATTDHSD